MIGGRTCKLNSWGKEFIGNSESELVESLGISVFACTVKVGGVPTG